MIAVSGNQWPPNIESGMKLILNQPCVSLYSPSHQTDSGFRKHHLDELQESRMQSGEAGDLTVVIEYPLGDDPEGEDEVWRCSLSGRPDIKFAIKLFPLNQLVRRFEVAGEPARMLWQVEESAYTHLQSEQGGLLPYSYGFYQVNTEQAKFHCHLMELVIGIDPNDLGDKMRSRDQEYRNLLAQAFLEGYLKIRRLDRFHGDIVGRNLLVTNPEAVLQNRARPRFVFIDWGRSVRISEALSINAQTIGSTFPTFGMLAAEAETRSLKMLSEAEFLSKAKVWIYGEGNQLWKEACTQDGQFMLP